MPLFPSVRSFWTYLFVVTTNIAPYAFAGPNGGPYGTDSKHLSPLSLERALAAGNALLAASKVGEGEGQYPQSALEKLENALKAAKQNGSEQTESFQKLYTELSRFESKVQSQYTALIDARATKETRYLYENLKATAADTLYYGAHDTLGYGVGWNGDNRRSDISDIVNDLPALFGWDLLELTQHGGENALRNKIEYAYSQGGIQTICWHAYDPLNNGFYHEPSTEAQQKGSVVATILPNGKHHEIFKTRLDKIAHFLKSLRGSHGESIPIIFRPWHEHNGFWFWWGKPHTDPKDFNALWRFTIEYLRDGCDVHNLIYAYSPDAGQYSKPEDFFEIYPGDDYTDLFGIDAYWMGDPSDDKKYFISKIQGLVNAAEERGKLAALTETGDKFDAENGGERLANQRWFTTGLLDSVLHDNTTRRIAFAMTWRNDRSTHHFNPYPEHPSVPDFKAFYEHPYTTFLSNLPPLYQSPTATP